MKRWHLSGYVFLAVVAALLLTVGAGAQGTCEEADALREAMLYEDAQTAYVELLKNDSQRDCAQAGIRELRHEQATNLYQLGQAYEEAKQYKSARDAYIEALKIDSTFNKSYEALNQVSDRLFTEVRTLADMGLYTEAGASLKKVVEENPGIDVPEDLEYLLGEKIAFWRQPWLRPLGELLLVVVVVVPLVVWRIYLWIRYSRKRRLDIQDFDKGATELEIGKGLAAMVEVSFKQIGELGAHGSRPSLIAGPIEKFEIPADVKSVHPYIKIVSQLIEWIFPPKVITLSGYLQKPEDAFGAGLTLTLVESRTGKIIANETIWQKDFDPAITPQVANDPAPYYHFAEPAAIWTLFQEEQGFKKKFALLGTRDWLSFAYFRAGVRWAQDGKDDKARQLYVLALAQDMNNRGALFNLGALETEAGQYKLAINRLEMARENEPKDRVWYNATYQLAATYHYQSRRKQDEAEKLQKEAEKLQDHAKDKAKKLLDDVKKLLEEASEFMAQAENEAEKLHKAIKDAIKARQKNEDKALGIFLESFKPMADIMYAAILADKKDDSKKISDNIINSIDFSKLSYRGRYNMACYYSIAGEKKTGDERDTAYKDALDHLEYALERGGGIVQWAKNDPSLKGLREDKKGDFDKLIEMYSAPVTPSTDLLPLAGLRLIGETYAKLLKEQGIVSHDDLILKAGTHLARDELAENLGINITLLRRWALLADLMRIVGINTQYANLLEAADVRSLEVLKKSKPHELAKLLYQVNTAQSLVKQPPPEETVLQWVQDANETGPKV